MHQLKPIHEEAIPRALAKAERYRLLNEPREAESICRDVLNVDPAQQEAVATLLLAITDQFSTGRTRLADAHEVLARVSSEYGRAYYEGVCLERWAKRLLEDGGHDQTAYEYLVQAMASYDRAAEVAEAGNDDALLRWNTCVRMIEQHRLEARGARGAFDVEIEGFDDEVPHR